MTEATQTKMAINRTTLAASGSTMQGTSAASSNGTGENTPMDDDRTIKDVEARLSRIEGQIRGIRNMSSERRLFVTQVWNSTQEDRTLDYQ